MKNYQVMAVRGHEAETIHVEEASVDVRRSTDLGPVEVIGHCEADTADAALDVAVQEFLEDLA